MKQKQKTRIKSRETIRKQMNKLYCLAQRIRSKKKYSCLDEYSMAVALEWVICEFNTPPSSFILKMEEHFGIKGD